MRLGAFELHEPVPQLEGSHALVRLEPWIDVGRVGTLTLSWLEAHFQAKELAKLARPGNFFDFTRYRPTVYYQGDQRRMDIPNAYVTYGQPTTGHAFLFIHLLEPHSHSEVYVESLVRLLTRFEVTRYCQVGSMYDLVPHTRPLLISGRATGNGMARELEEMGIGSSNYQGPSSITALISQCAIEMGIETMSLMVHLPQYTQLDEDYIGAVRLMGVLSELYDVPADESYIEKAERQVEQVSLAVENNPQMKATVEQLERHYDSLAKTKPAKGTPQLSPEVERFLNEMGKRLEDS